MGNCYSHVGKDSYQSYPSHPPPLSPPAQDLVDDLLNRWRHGEVTFLRRTFREARMAQEVAVSLSKQSKSSKQSYKSNPSGNVNCGGESSQIGNGGGRPISMVSHSNDSVMDTGSLNRQVSGNSFFTSFSSQRKIRNHLTSVGFGMLFPLLEDIPVETHANAFLCFCSNGSEGISFCDLLRGLALCCRGSRVERLRFLLDVFSSSKHKYRGTGEEGSAEDAMLRDMIVLTTYEASNLLQWCSSMGENSGVSPNLNVFELNGPKATESSSKTVKKGSFAKLSSSVQRCFIPEKGITLGQYFAWAEVYLSTESLDAALYPFSILPTSIEERQRAVELLSGFVLTPEHTLFAISIQWWKEWAAYCRLEEGAHLMNDHVKALGLVNGVGCQSSAAVGLSDSHSPPSLRPHEIDNSPLQGNPEWELKCNLRVRKDFIFVPEKLWMELVLWYGGGPAFPRVVGSLPEGHSNPLSSPYGDNILLGSFFVDPYPWGVYVSTCTVSGHPSARSRLVLCSPYVMAHSIAKQILAEFEACYGIIFRLWILAKTSALRTEQSANNSRVPLKQYHVDHWRLLSEDDLNLNLMALGFGQSPLERRKLLMETQVKQATLPEHQQPQQIGGGYKEGEGNTRSSTTTGKSSHGGAFKNKILSSITESASELERGPAAVGSATAINVGHGCNPSENVMTSQNHNGSDSHDVNAGAGGEGASVSRGGLKGGTGEKCQSQDSYQHNHHEANSLIWPRDRFIEPKGFRQFNVQDRVDVLGYQGRWYLGRIIAVERIKLSGPKGSCPSLEEGPVGRLLKMAGRTRMSRNSVLFPIRTYYANSANNHQLTTNIGVSSTAASREGGPSSSGSNASSPSSSCKGEEEFDELELLSVRVHFDNFSSEWDEILSAESPRLSTPGSYTSTFITEQRASYMATSTTAMEMTPCSTSKVPNLSTELRKLCTGSSQAEQQDVLHEFSPHRPTITITTTGGGGIVKEDGSRQCNSHDLSSINSLLPSSANEQHARMYVSMRQLKMDIIDYRCNSVPIKRKGNTVGRPPIPGACGLINVGNSCYMNSAVQCLSHTPLLRAYLLSGMFLPEMNRGNPFGTGGMLAVEFSMLLKALWSGELVCVDPIKFKQGLGKWKSDFAGNEQQDSQEVIQFMLDGLHEDVNRVLEKPYIPAPDDDDGDNGKSDEIRASEQWCRHLRRNRSKIVDIFQGQLRTEVVCGTCRSRNVKFDPFMHLSLPIPNKGQMLVTIVLLRYVHHSAVDMTSTANEKWKEREEGGPVRRSGNRYSLNLPCRGTVSDIREHLSNLCGIDAERLSFACVCKGWITHVLKENESLSTLRTNILVVAYEQPIPIPELMVAAGKWNKRNIAQVGMGGGGVKGSSMKDRSSALSGAVKDQKYGEVCHYEQQSPYFNLDPMDADNHLDLNDSTWPTSIGDVKIHERFDSINMHGEWCPGTVVEAIECPIYQVCFHFDYCSSSSDVWLTEDHWKADKVAPLYSKAKNRPATYRIIVINRAVRSGMVAQSERSSATQKNHCQPRGGSDGGRYRDPLLGSRRSSNSAAYPSNQYSSAMLLHGTPWLLYCDSRASTRHLWRLVVERIAPDISDAVLLAKALAVSDCEDDLTLLQKLPFTIRILPSNQLRDDKGGVELRPDSTTRAVSVLYGDTLIAIDWIDHYRTYLDPLEDTKHLSFLANEVDPIKSGTQLYSCLEEFTNEESIEVNDDDGYYCKKCEAKRAVSTKTDLWKVPDILVIHIKRFHHTEQCREKIRSLVIFPLSGLDVSNFVAGLSPQRKSANLGGLMYDLYGVLNHMGGMTGGHYTAYCRCTPCASGGIEDTDYWGLEHFWLNFDDDIIEEISPDKIVSESAYVFFYRRRKLTPSNIVNNTV